MFTPSSQSSFQFEMIRFCLGFFQICGFYPVEIKKQTISHKNSLESILLRLWSLVNFGIVSYLIIYAGICHDKFLYSLTPIGEINDILVYFSLLIAHLVAVIESFVKREYFLTFWLHYEKILLIGKESTRSWRNWLLIKIILFVAFSFSIEMLVITSIQTDSQWCKFWYYEVFSLLMTRNRHLQHIFFIDVIYFTLDSLNTRLRNKTTWAKTIVDDSYSRRFMYRNVSQSKEQFKHLMEMLICVNRSFCWSQVLNFGQHFIEITAELNWVYVFATGPDFLWGKMICKLFISDVRKLSTEFFRFKALNEGKIYVEIHFISSNYYHLYTSSRCTSDAAQFSHEMHQRSEI